ncbi:hypothetical protein [uncultured Thiodictyon sp.]|nr:hypothetical protein [uncultured Thiodictyon sp.]
MSVVQLRSMISFVRESRGVYFVAALIFLLVLIILSATGIEMSCPSGKPA